MRKAQEEEQKRLADAAKASSVPSSPSDSLFSAHMCHDPYLAVENGGKRVVVSKLVLLEKNVSVHHSRRM